MHITIRSFVLVFTCTVFFCGNGLAQDWPQWRGPNRDAKAMGFSAPKAWPEKLNQKWKVTVGDGVATPALVGDKLFVFTRQDKDEIIRCLEASTGKEIWKDQNEVQGATGPAQRFPGPRSSPTVADGRVITLGVRGLLNCYDSVSGRKLWTKDDFKGTLPQFFTSCSPIVADGMVVVQLGGERSGAIVAYDLASGAEKWKWTSDGTAYSSPVVLSLGGNKILIAETAKSIVALTLADGKLLWQTPFVAEQRGYNAATPIVAGQTVLYTGSRRGTRAVALEKDGDKITVKELWSNKDNGVQFNTPVVKDRLVFGISERDALFCLYLKDGVAAWAIPIKGGRGYGSVVDVGEVLLALTPPGDLIVFAPTDKEFRKLATYKVGESETYAYPVVAGNRIFVKDKDSVTLWTVE